jgi:CxxC-x17-CxxC domain-containing protein
MVPGRAHRPLICVSPDDPARPFAGLFDGARSLNLRLSGDESWCDREIPIAKPLDAAAILRDMSSGAAGTADDALPIASGSRSDRAWDGSEAIQSHAPEEERESVYEDRSLTCRDCSEEFSFSSGEQAFFASKGLLNDPQRCPNCRAVAKRARTTSGPREFHAAICGSCGGQAMVPFAPRNDRPVYCSSCFDKVRAGTIAEHAVV